MIYFILIGVVMVLGGFSLHMATHPSTKLAEFIDRRIMPINKFWGLNIKLMGFGGIVVCFIGLILTIIAK